MKIYIYCIYFPLSNKNYIGLTYNLKYRLQAHFKSGSLVCKALWKYNDWQVSILHTCKTYEEAFRIEIEEIRNFNCVAPNGYNLTHGGESIMLGKKHLKESKDKISTSMKGKKNAKGFKHTKEYKQNLAKRTQGKKYAQGHTYKPSKEIIENFIKRLQGNNFNPFKFGKDNPSYNKLTKIKRIKTRVKKLRQKLRGEI